MNNKNESLLGGDQDHLTPEELNSTVSRLKIVAPIIGGIIALILLGIGAFFVFSEQNIPADENILPNNSELGSDLNASPTSFPFQEMTIPYLRSRAFESNLAALNEHEVKPNYSSYLTSYDSEGFDVNGLLTIPAGNMPSNGWPAIIFVHGYIPPANYRTTANYADYVDYLARNGFVVFKIDLRGHGDSEGEPGGGYYSADYVMDVLNAKAALLGQDFVDAAKIGFWGHSMAGNVVSRAMAASPDTPAIVIWAGAVYTYSDFSEYGIDDNSYRPPAQNSESRQRRNELFEKYGAFDGNSDFWKQVPMTNYLEDIKGAIQLNHAINDDVVSIEFSRNLSSILDEANIEHELNEYPSGGHNISGATFSEAMEDTVRWYREKL